MSDSKSNKQFSCDMEGVESPAVASFMEAFTFFKEAIKETDAYRNHDWVELDIHYSIDCCMDEVRVPLCTSKVFELVERLKQVDLNGEDLVGQYYTAAFKEYKKTLNIITDVRNYSFL